MGRRNATGPTRPRARRRQRRVRRRVGRGSSVVAEVPGSRDARPHHVRMHDAFGDVLKAVLNSGDLPACGGTPAATVWHINDPSSADRYGLAISEHGTLLPIGDALRRSRPERPVRADREQQGRPALPRPDHPDRHPRPNRRPSRPRPRLLLPRLRPAPITLPTPPHHRLGQRRPHRHRQPHPALRPPPPRTRQTRLALPHVGRATALATTRLARPHTEHPSATPGTSPCPPTQPETGQHPVVHPADRVDSRAPETAQSTPASLGSDHQRCWPARGVLS